MNWPTWLQPAHLRHLFAQPNSLWLLLGLLVLLIVAIRARRRRRRVLMQLGRLPALLALTDRRRQWRFIRGFCLVMGLIALVVGIAGPQWGLEPEPTSAPGRDLVVVLDVSRSMLAEDTLPSRQEKAKEALKELVEKTVKKHGGHRLGLVAFAARAQVVCPLTHDYDHFLAKVEELDAANLPRDLRPDEDAVSGTRMGAGLMTAVNEAHDSRFRGFQDILMISDGDDPKGDYEYRKGADAAHDAGIPVFVVGVGDPEKDSRIPLGKDLFLNDPESGKLAQTRLRRPVLQEIAKKSRGEYIEAGTHDLPLSDLFLNKIEPGAKREAADDALPLYRQRYSWFFGLALSFLAAEMTFGAPLGVHRLLSLLRKKRTKDDPKGKKPDTSFRARERETINQ
jgi:Ca-activated chloride channel family protein